MLSLRQCYIESSLDVLVITNDRHRAVAHAHCVASPCRFLYVFVLLLLSMSSSAVDE